MKGFVTIAGAGPGEIDHITVAALRAAAFAHILLAFIRLLKEPGTLKSELRTERAGSSRSTGPFRSRVLPPKF